MSDEDAEGFGFEPAPAVDANAPVGGEKAPAGGGNAPPPPAYVETPVMKKVDKGAGPAKLSDNYANSMAQEDIRLNDRDIGYRTKFGQGPLGGKTGAVKGSRNQVTQPTSKARPTLITQQPGEPRSTNGYVPYLQPEPTSAPGHTLFVMDIPAIAGHKGKKVAWEPAKRIVINQNHGKGAQISLETYIKGKSAEIGRLGKPKKVQKKDGSWTEKQEWMPAHADVAACRETINLEMFNIAEVQRVMISQTTLSTMPETEISINKSKAADRIQAITELTTENITKTSRKKHVDVHYEPNCCTSFCWDCCVNLDLPRCCGGHLCCFECPRITTEDKPGCDCCGFCAPGSWACFKEIKTERIEVIKKKATRQNSIIRNVTTKGKKKENKNEVDNPFDMVNVTNLKLVLRSASAGGDVIEFVWRVQSVGETETDLCYNIAPKLRAPCIDPTSSARTLANVINYLNS